MRMLPLYAAASVAATLCVLAPHNARSDESKDALLVETILRLDDFDLASSEKAQAAVARYLEHNWAGERYLDLIDRFELKDSAPGVLKLALEKVDDPIGADASVLLVKLGSGTLLAEVLEGDDSVKAEQASKAISRSGDPALVGKLSAVVADSSRPANVRSAALAAIYGINPNKQPELLAKVKSGDLSEDLKQAASEILLLSRDPKIRDEAQSIFAAGEGDFPPLAELLKRAGDVENGKRIFATKTCTVCHQAGGMGIDFGPGLSEIGDKLNKEALYSAIIDPSAGISMGFEGWEITLKDGTPLLGTIQETEEDLTVTMIGGAKRTLPKDEVASKKKLEQSLMYPGLHRMMTTDELVDLVEFLSSLKKTKPNS